MPQRTLITIVMLLLMALPSLASGEGAEAGRASPRVEEVGPGVYAYIGGGGTTNSGFIVTERGVIVIDSQGPAERARDLLDRIKKKTDKPVAFVINTHYHGDHTFGNQYFGGTVISHENTRRLLITEDRAHRARFRKFFGPDSLVDFRLRLPELTFRYELRLYEGGNEIIIQHTGSAHTQGDAYVYLPVEGVIFTGDLLYNKRLPWLGEGSATGSIRALERILSLGARTYVPGHGEVATRKDVLEFKAYLQDLVKEVRRLHDEGKTKEEVMKEISLPRYKDYVKYNEWLPRNAAAVYQELFEDRTTRNGNGEDGP